MTIGMYITIQHVADFLIDQKKANNGRKKDICGCSHENRSQFMNQKFFKIKHYLWVRYKHLV